MLATAREVNDELAGENLMFDAQALLIKTGKILAAAEEMGDLRTTLAAIREARATLETLMRLGFAETLGPDSPLEVEVESPPYWKFIVDCVAEEFQHWPTAAIRIANRIEELGDDRLMSMIEEAVPVSMWAGRARLANRDGREPPWPWMIVEVSDQDQNPDPEP
jgi:hypothetical protein